MLCIARTKRRRAVHIRRAPLVELGRTTDPGRVACGPAVRLHVVSDLHVEFAAFELPTVDADVVVLAGDVGQGTTGIRLARRWAGGRPVLFVAGNHEYYRHALPALTDQMRAEAAASPVQVLENDEVVLEGVRFLGCTLWSDFMAAGPDELERSMEVCGRLINDYEVITWSEEGGPCGPRTPGRCTRPAVTGWRRGSRRRTTVPPS